MSEGKITATVNEIQTGYTYVTNNSKQKKNLGFGETFRLFHLKFWIFITSLLVFASAVGVFHPEIDMAEAITMLLISVPAFVFLWKRHKSLKEYFNSAEYECKKEDKRRIKAQLQ